MIRSPRLRAALLGLALAAPAAGLALTPVAAHAQGRRDAGAEQFVQTQAQRGLNILRSGSPQGAEKAQFRAFVDEVADVPRITDFVLGRYNRTVSPAQKAEFARTFRDYANGVYESRLGQYHGQILKVTGSTARRPGDVVVTSQVVGGGGAPVRVDWRVIQGGGGWKVVDVNVSGVWLAITEQQDFASTLSNHGGNIQVLIDQLRGQAR